MAYLVRTVLIITVLVISDCSAQNITSCITNIGTKMAECMSKLPPSLLSVVGAMGNNPASLLEQLPTFCQPANLNGVKEAFGCVYENYINCVPAEWRRFTPTKKQSENAIDHICRNNDDLDGACIATRGPEYITCMRPKLPMVTPNNLTVEQVRTYVCGLEEDGSRCLRDTFNQCPKSTTGTILAETLRLQIPAACNGCSMLSSSLLILILLILVHRYLY